jgi:hypothetical protein
MGNRRREEVRQRLDILARSLERLSADDFRLTALQLTDRERIRLRERAVDAAVGAGLADVVDDALPRFRDWVLRAHRIAGYDPSPIALNWGRSQGPAADWVSGALAVEDSALGAIAFGLVSDDDYQALIEPLSIVRSRHPSPSRETPLAWFMHRVTRRRDEST